MLRACLANKKWSLNFRHSSLKFSHPLPLSFNCYHLIFFTLFMNPTTVTVSNHFCFVIRVPFSSPSVFLFFSFPLPLQPCLSPKAETQTQKNVSTSLASSVPSSPVNNTQTLKQNNNHGFNKSTKMLTQTSNKEKKNKKLQTHNH